MEYPKKAAMWDTFWEYPKKGCNVGYFLSTGTNQNSNYHFATLKCHQTQFFVDRIEIGQVAKSAQIEHQADLYFLEKVISRCSERYIL